MTDMNAAGYGNTPSFAEDPVTYLLYVVSRPPSRESLLQLAGSVATTISSRNVPSEVAFLYLQAAARHLPCESASRVVVFNPFAAAAAATAASCHDPSNDHQKERSSVDADVQSSKDVNLILEAVGNAVTRCSPRSLITQSGILPVLTSMLPSVSPSSNSTTSSTTLSVPPLTNVHVELLQACLYSQQYRYAETLVANTWPRPTSAVSVRQVLRYFYIRGTIHIGCDNWKMARRCFWTCLSIPGEIVSSIAIAAWKKLVLVQCRTLTEPPIPGGGGGAHSAPTTPMQLPKSAPACLTRFLSSAFSPSSSAQTSTLSTAQASLQMEDPEAMHMVENSENEGPQQQDNRVGGGGTAAASDGYPSLGVKAYAALVGAFVRRDQVAFTALLKDHESLFRRDGNMGLVKQCHAQFLRRQVCFYSRIYSVLSLADLSSFLDLAVDQVENILLSLSIEKVWPIQISNGVVHFPKLPPLPPRQLEGDRVLDEQEIVQMARMVQKLDATISASLTKKGAAGLTSEAKAGPRGVEDV